ncbi:GNAT family N-acetyltransferase [Hyphomonas sp. FCG-A18]|uniref:GNAT family N-acetyltransferase n=1 Tax=Hyphomonas sp. FCG-A18 TaxID=3080019 RepID=UPI002B2A3031|nr:GNAT family N-acetyltransferase [Hyphomonas sp. FCG-A18]
MDETSFKLRMVDGLTEVDRAAWDSVANPSGRVFDPFLSWDFLEALEATEAAQPETGWTPAHLLVEGAAGTLKAAMPLYAKTHSQGEFVFDHSWADAYYRAGGEYYPKLLCAVPFTPVTGRRLLTPPGPDEIRLQRALLAGAVQLAEQNGFSSLHVNFLQPDMAAALQQDGLLIRTDQQFHWQNDGYSSFDDFLAVLSSAKRKNLRKERAKAQNGLRFEHVTRDAITEAHWDAFYDFYVDTGQRKWGSPYLNRETFSVLGERMAEHILLIFAMDRDRPIAGALNMIGGEALYGRYWGCIEQRPMLHFETCYYQAIDYAIANGLKTVEAGAQGGHKLARGYGPVTTYSAHWIAHPGLRDAIHNYLEREREAVEREQGYLRKRTPFKKAE